MSRSYLKTPIIGNTTAKSEKLDKRKANRSYRKLVRMRLIEGNFNPLHIRECSNVWSFDKDGKRYCKDLPLAELRK